MTNKICPHCKQDLPTEAFTKSRRQPDGLQIQCRQCQGAYYLSHRAEILARDQRYKAEHRIEQTAYQKGWRQRNPNKLKAQNSRAHMRKGAARRALNQNRRARKAASPGCVTAEQWATIKASYGFRCAYCGQRKPLTQDHVIPLSKNGHHSPENIVPACKSCNCAKRDRPADRLQMHLI